MVQTGVEQLLEVHGTCVERYLGRSFETATAASAGAGPTVGFENIVGVGIGEKVIGGGYVGTQCVKVYVVEKRSPEGIDKEALIPPQIEGVPTDIEEIGEILALRHIGRVRPAPGGVSVGHP